MKKPELAIPKSDSKAERKAAQRASRRLRDANRDECLRLDCHCCQNPFCKCFQSWAWECNAVSSHHICGRTGDNRFDGVEYRITLSMRCHDKYDKDRKGMLKILKQLKRIANSNYRWDPAIEELEKMV